MSQLCFSRLRARVSWLAAIALFVQPYAALANSAVPMAVAPLCPDVALQSSGTLLGQIVDTAGRGVANAPIVLTGRQQRWQTISDPQGRFALKNLAGGTYTLSAAGQLQTIRAWQPGTAPPSARQGVLFAPTGELVRGQHTVGPNTSQYFSNAKHYLANPWVFSGIVATAVAIPVAIHNVDDDSPATP